MSARSCGLLLIQRVARSRGWRPTCSAVPSHGSFIRRQRAAPGCRRAHAINMRYPQEMFYSWIRAKQIEILERQWKLPAPLRGEWQPGELPARSKTAAEEPTATRPDTEPESRRD